MAQIVGHLPLGKNGKFAKVFFTSSVQMHLRDLTVSGSAFNIRDVDWKEVSCVLCLLRQKNIVDNVKKQLMWLW